MNMIATRNALKTKAPWFVSLLAGCLMGTASMSGAYAAAGDEAPRLVVTYDARSLLSDSGARALYRRLQQAARQVCPDESRRDLSHSAVVQRCREASVERAVRDINNPRLAEVFAARDPSRKESADQGHAG